MRSPAVRSSIAALAMAAGLGAQLPAAAAQTCGVPTLNGNVCANKGGSIDDYISCYRDLYDQNVIPSFTAIAQCTHAKASFALDTVLAQASATATGAVTTAMATIDAALADQNGAANQCTANINAVTAVLQPYLDAEQQHASDLEAYRRAHYTPETLVFFENALLTARQVRAACDGPLQTILTQLKLLSALKAQQLDYCQVLRDSANYEQLTHIDGLSQWTMIDPNIHFDQYFNFSISLNSQCGYYDFSGSGPATIRYSSCPTLTTEYSQTLTGLDGALGWLAANRNVIIPVSTVTAATVFTLIGYGGASASLLGAAVGAVVGLVISAVEYYELQAAIDELHDLLASKEKALKAAVANNFITQQELSDLIVAKCGPEASRVAEGLHDLFDNFDVDAHIGALEAFYKASDDLNHWYDGLFLWATTPGADGKTFLDQLTQEALLAQRDHFDQQVFAARAGDEIAAAKNELTNLKATVTQLACPGTIGRITRSKVNAGVNGFNLACTNTLDALAVAPDQPIAFADPAITSTVTCRYNGFRNDVDTLVIQDGDGFASNLIVKNASGAVLAQLGNVTSDTDFTQLGFPGFTCQAVPPQTFGTSAASRLKPDTLKLSVHDNLLGVQGSDATALRTSVQSLDSQLRFKVIVCARQMGITLNTPRTADACGIPKIP